MPLPIVSEHFPHRARFVGAMDAMHRYGRIDVTSSSPRNASRYGLSKRHHASSPSTRRIVNRGDRGSSESRSIDICCGARGAPPLGTLLPIESNREQNVQILMTFRDVTKERDEKCSTRIRACSTQMLSLSLSLYLSLRTFLFTYNTLLAMRGIPLRRSPSLRREEFWKLFAFGFRGAFVERERVDDALGELSQRVSRGIESFVQMRCTRVFVLQQAF